MFGLDAGVWIAVLILVLIPVVLGAYKEYNRDQGEKVSFGKADRRCVSCEFEGKMKTWLGNHAAPQFIAALGLLFFFIPGLIFIALSWGKYKCPSCGAIGKNQQLSATQKKQKACPFCAEAIKPEAIKCKHCGSALTPPQLQ